MSAPYDQVINKQLIRIAKTHGITLRRGIYACVAGPNLETKAEYRFLKNIGADVVGMSTVPEVIAANQLSMPVSAISVLTDDCDPDNLKPISIEEVIHTAQKAEQDLIKLLRNLIKKS